MAILVNMLIDNVREVRISILKVLNFLLDNFKILFENCLDKITFVLLTSLIDKKSIN